MNQSVPIAAHKFRLFQNEEPVMQETVLTPVTKRRTSQEICDVTVSGLLGINRFAVILSALLGMLPFEYTVSGSVVVRKMSRIGALISCSTICCIVASLPMGYYVPIVYTYPKKNYLSNILDNLRFAIGVVFTCGALTVHWTKRDHVLRFISKLVEAERTLQQLEIPQSSTKKSNNYLLVEQTCALSFFLVSGGLAAAVIQEGVYTISPSASLLLVTYFVRRIVLQWQFTTSLRTLNKKFTRVYHLLDSLKTRETSLQSTWKKRNSVFPEACGRRHWKTLGERPGGAVPRLASAHLSLLDAGQALNGAAAHLSLVYAAEAVATALFVGLLAARLLLDESPGAASPALALIFMPVSWTVFNLLLVVFWCHDTIVQANRCALSAHKSFNSIDDQEAKEKILLLSRQLLDRKLQFTSARCFSMDVSFIFSVAEIVSSYLVVLIQKQYEPATAAATQQAGTDDTK